MQNEKKEITKIINPHKIISRDVTVHDIDKVFEDAKKMYEMIGTKIGNYSGFYAIAHQQITDQDPMRFFLCNPDYSVFDDLPEAVIINPKIIRHTNQVIEKEEGCLSFSKLPPIKTERWNKCEVEFQVLKAEGDSMVISEVHTKNLSGRLAQVFQHEIGHFECNYIYKIN